jgi:hypothetical protein
MYKQHLLNNIEKEIKICRRLFTKILPEQLDFRPREDIRSILEVLQYLSIIGWVMPGYWLKTDDTDFNTFFGAKATAAKAVKPDQFLGAMDAQLAEIKQLFSTITEDDLLNKEVSYPWGGAEPLGQAIIATSIKWLSAYKLQLFLFIKLSGEQKLGTGDAWLMTELEA